MGEVHGGGGGTWVRVYRSELMSTAHKLLVCNKYGACSKCSLVPRSHCQYLQYGGYTASDQILVVGMAWERGYSKCGVCIAKL